jgi:hypothetical protein
MRERLRKRMKERMRMRKRMNNRFRLIRKKMWRRNRRVSNGISWLNFIVNTAIFTFISTSTSI